MQQLNPITGVVRKVFPSPGGSIPTNTHSEGSITPVSALYKGHFSIHIRAWPIKDFVRMTVLRGIKAVMVMVMGMRVGR